MPIDIIKIVAIGLISCFFILVLKPSKPELALALGIVCGCAIVYMAVRPMYAIIDVLQNLAENAGIDFVFVGIILKIIGVAYLVSIGSSFAKDAGQGAIADKLEFAGKVCIIMMSVPIVQTLVDSLLKFL